MSQTTIPSSPDAGPGFARGPRRDGSGPSLVASGGRQRRWSLALVAVLMTVGSGLAFVVLYLNAGDREPYLVVTSDVAAGQEIEADHLGTARVSTDPQVAAVPVSDRDQVVGQVAAVDLVEGSLVVTGSYGEDERLPDGQAVVAVPVAVERVPSPAPQAQDTVEVYDVGVDPDSESNRVGSVSAGTATVLGLTDHGAVMTFTLLVEEHDLSAITATVESGGAYVALVNGD